MNKLVYLHELDSVRNTPEEILIGQQAMYEEIVINGNCVVITYNQFTDSKAFLCAVKNEEQYEHIIDLFRKGYIKLSNFTLIDKEEDENGNIRDVEIDIYTPSQYIQHAIEENKKKKRHFIFSGMKIDSEDSELMNLMGDALKYSNPSILNQYVTKDDVDKEKIEELKHYVRMLLALSVEDLAYTPIKREPIITLEELMNEILATTWSAYYESNKEFAQLMQGSIAVLKEISSQITSDQINKRSNWLRKIYTHEKNPKVELAAAIVNMAYNYVVEDSISNVSKHFDDQGDTKIWMSDFAYRIWLYWKEHVEKGLHECYKPVRDANGEAWKKILSWENFPEWETATRVTEEKRYFTKKEEKTVVEYTGRLYEDKYEDEKKSWKTRINKAIILHILISFAYIFGIDVVNAGTNWIGNGITSVFENIGVVFIPIAAYLFNLIINTILLGTASSMISQVFKLPDILENLENLWNGFKDAHIIKKAAKNIAYVCIKKE